MSKASKAFTIVELLIVIVVIAILVAIAIVSYSGITSRATAASLQSDLANSKKVLANYNATYGSYPTGLDASSCPSGPTVDNNYCLKPSGGTTITYQPSSTTSPVATYSIYASKSNLVYVANESINGTATNLTTPCPSGFIPVPGSTTYGTSDFCVMKYEAKNVAGVATSVAAGTPWVSVTQTGAGSATTLAAAACSGCQLITEAQWMTIAQNVLSVASNWSGGAVGSGYIYSGHNDNAPANALAASTNDLDGYYGTNDSASSGANQRRTLTLTNGQVIWDLAGNVWDWTAGQMTGGQPTGMAAWGWYQWTAVSGGTFTVNPYPSNTGLTGASSWDSSNGIGQIYGLTSDATLRGFLRSGDWNNGASAGVLTLRLGYTPSNSNTNFGFRASR